MASRDDDTPSYASPPCFMHEVDPAYMGLLKEPDHGVGKGPAGHGAPENVTDADSKRPGASVDAPADPSAESEEKSNGRTGQNSATGS